MPGRRELLAALVIASLALGACGWDPTRPFDRDAPPVKQAIGQLDAGDAAAASMTLEEYLSTGACEDGKIGTPEILKKRANGTFDLGLSLFSIGESYGRRFGDEELDAGDVDKTHRDSEIDCALRIVRAIATSEHESIDLRAHARYLEGNLLFLGGRYEEAVTAYDESLRLAPGLVDAGDPVARDAAWNRAVALRRIEDKKDAGQDASQDSGQDGGGEGGGDAAKDAKGDGGGDSGKGDSGGDGAAPHDDSGADSGAPPQAKNDEDAGPPPPPRANQDERMLDQLENAPTVQQEAAKKSAQKRRVRGMADK